MPLIESLLRRLIFIANEMGSIQDTSGFHELGRSLIIVRS